MAAATISGFDLSLITETHVLYEAPEGGVDDYKCSLALYEDPAFSTWAAGLVSATDFENYMVSVYSDSTLAYRFEGTSYDGNYGIPLPLAMVIGSEGATVLTVDMDGSFNKLAMDSTDYAAWAASPGTVTNADAGQTIIGLNDVTYVEDANANVWYVKAQPSESFDGNWDATFTSVWDERIDAGDTVFAKFIDLNDGSTVVEGEYTFPGGVNSATSGIAGALAGLVACISLFFF